MISEVRPIGIILNDVHAHVLHIRPQMGVDEDPLPGYDSRLSRTQPH
jgi:hypothetical protein